LLTTTFNRAKLWRFLVPFLLLLLCQHYAGAQYFALKPNRKHVSIPFRMVRNLVIIQLKINGKGPYNFVLDTGVGLMLITDPTLIDSVNITNKRTLKIAGLGKGGEYDAYITPALDIDIPGLESYDIIAAILKKDPFDLSNYAGMPVHGLLGYEFFTNMAVNVDFADSTVSVSRPKDTRQFKKWFKLPITIEDRKPYINANVTLNNGVKTTDKLIVDLGAGHPLSLENVAGKQGFPPNFIAANLGVGLTGPIDGFIGRVKEIELGRFKVKEVITSFPNDNDTSPKVISRNGSLGVGTLKRFTVIFDYANNLIYLKPAANYSEPFEHDMSGLEYYAAGDNFKRVIISRVEPGSAGDVVGLEKDDEILSINFKPVSGMSLEQIDDLFKSKDNRSLLLEIYHEKKYEHCIITLKRRV
jgi:hypothetical protein